MALQSIVDHPNRTRLLARLVKIAQSYVRIEDDVKHQVVYTPDARDFAERARAFALSNLLDTPGPEATALIRELLDSAVFGEYSERINYLARERLAKQAEPRAISTSDVLAFERVYVCEPKRDDELLRVMIDRINDLSDTLRNDDFSDRRTLKAIDEEIEMQRTLALRLRDKSLGLFSVSREDEVVNRKRPDIRFATNAGAKACLEVKLAHKWSVDDLEKAIRVQLVGQYLRAERAKAGCLLITHNGAGRWFHPQNRSAMTVDQVFDYLRTKARELEVEKNGTVRIEIAMLNLADEPVVDSVKRASRRKTQVEATRSRLRDSVRRPNTRTKNATR